MLRLLHHYPYKFLFSIGIVSAFLSPYLMAERASGQAANTEFQVFDATLFSGKPDLRDEGVKHLAHVRSDDLWPAHHLRTEPHELTIRNTVSEFNSGDSIALDIQHWIVDRRASANVRDANIENFTRVADIVHDQVPGIKMGYHALLPRSSYWPTIRSDANAIRSWEADNVRLKPIAQRVDVIIPALYTLHNDPRGWAKYATANIAEARKYGKPVYVALNINYDDSSVQRGQPVPPHYWKLQLETVKAAGAAGVVIRGGNGKHWDEDAPWWIETKKFIASLSAPAPGPIVQRTLTIKVNGAGTTAPAAGAHAYVDGSIVAVTATPGAGQKFVNWTGHADCADGAVAMNSDKTCIANFAALSVVTKKTLTINVSGSGTTMPAVGASQYQQGSVVAIAATPGAGQKFVSWSGHADCADGAVTMDTDRTCTANFAALQPQPLPPPQGKFQVLDGTLFTGKPDLNAMGVKRLPFVYAGALWPAGHNRDAIHEQSVRNVMRQFKAGDLVCLDIEQESWWLHSKPAHVIAQNIQKFRAMSDLVNSIVPGIRHGYYAIAPLRNFWAPVRSDTKSWEAANRDQAVIMEKAQASFPSLYTFYGQLDQPGTLYIDNWVKYAKANIAEAKKYGKPVYPILWFDYHDSNKRYAFKPIAPEFWRLQLETVKAAGADGVVIWGGWDAKARRPALWNDSAPWWVETKKFMATLR